MIFNTVFKIAELGNSCVSYTHKIIFCDRDFWGVHSKIKKAKNPPPSGIYFFPENPPRGVPKKQYLQLNPSGMQKHAANR